MFNIKFRGLLNLSELLEFHNKNLNLEILDYKFLLTFWSQTLIWTLYHF